MIFEFTRCIRSIMYMCHRDARFDPFGALQLFLGAGGNSWFWDVVSFL